MDKLEQVQQYAQEKYKRFKDKQLIVNEFETHYTIQLNKDESPLILGKTVV